MENLDANWQEVCEQMGIDYRFRSVSRALLALCVFHDEKTPSLWMYPNGNYYCYGCGSSGRIEDFSQKLEAGRQRAIENNRILLAKGIDDSEPPF